MGTISRHNRFLSYTCKLLLTYVVIAANVLDYKHNVKAVSVPFNKT